VYDMPLSDAILVENGAYTSVNRIARTVERTRSLAQAYIANGKKLNEAIVNEAISMAQGKYGMFRGKGKTSRRAGQTGILAGKISSKSWDLNEDGTSKTPKLTSIGQRGRLIIAEYLGVLNAYRRSAARKGNLREQVLGKPEDMAFREVTRSKGGKGKVFAKDMKPKYAGTPDDRRAKRKQIMGSTEYASLVYSDSSNSARRLARRLLRGKGERPSDFDARWAQERADKGYGTRKVDGHGLYNTTAFDSSIPRSATSRKAGKKRASASFTFAGKSATGKDVRITPKQAISMPQMYSAETVAQARAHMAAAVKNNPFGYDDLALVSNPSGIGFLDSAESAISNVPVVGEYIAPIVTPAVLGAAAFGVHYFAVPYVEKYLPAAAKPFAYTIGGSAVGIVSGVVAAKAQDSSIRNAAALIGGAAVAIGVGLDLFRKYGGGKAGDADFGDDMGADEFGALALDNPGVFGSDEFGALALDNPGVFGALALDNPGVFGDGMAYQLGPVGGFNGFGALGYANASLADAYYSGADFDGVEGEAILAGPHAFAGAAGPAPRMAAGARTHASNLAGRRYHRWAWLINEIGFDSLQKLAALSPSDRLAAIQALRARALQAYQAKLATQGGEFHRLPAGLSVGGPVAPSAAPGVGDALGYGALAVADY